MWFKIGGAFLILLVSSVIGFQLAARCKERPQQIRQLISCVTALNSYITYAHYPLAEALVYSIRGIDGPIADFVQTVANNLTENQESSPQKAIHTVLKAMHSKLLLQKAEQEILEMLGANLGTMNREEQSNYLVMIIEQLKRRENEALRERDLNTKMYRYLGICSGLTITILLL